MLPERMFSTFQTASQGLAVQRDKIAVASRNIANAQTSSPAGSNDVYRPQAVQTSQPDSVNFQRVLEQSMSSLKTTSPKHISTPGLSTIMGSNSNMSNLGPVSQITEQESFRYEFDPNHPDADDNGMVRYPDVDLIREMTSLVSANRLYEANLSSIEAEKELIKRALEI
ncbi:MAG: flagellar basal body rod protein FlgC [Balneolia bacterium]|nr:flagellar basal body rod protein FlgC [Balneolia bacterium]